MSAGQSVGALDASFDRAEQLNFSANVDANSGEEIEREVPFSGLHIELLYAAQSATQNQVGVQMSRGDGETVFPADRGSDFVNLSGQAHPFTLVYPVERKEVLEVRYDNRDSQKHYLNVISTVVRTEEV